MKTRARESRLVVFSLHLMDLVENDVVASFSATMYAQRVDRVSYEHELSHERNQTLTFSGEFAMEI